MKRSRDTSDTEQGAPHASHYNTEDGEFGPHTNKLLHIMDTFRVACRGRVTGAKRRGPGGRVPQCRGECKCDHADFTCVCFASLLRYADTSFFFMCTL